VALDDRGTGRRGVAMVAIPLDQVGEVIAERAIRAEILLVEKPFDTASDANLV
jgi:hypothetical protein